MNDTARKVAPTAEPSARGELNDASSAPRSSARPEDVAPPPEELPTPSHDLAPEQLVGPATFVRLMNEDVGTVVVRDDAGLVLDSTGEYFHVSGASADAFPIDTPVRVAVARAEGLYSFTSRVVSPVNNHGENSLKIRVPRHLRSFDRRRYFRQASTMQTTVRRRRKGKDGKDGQDAQRKDKVVLRARLINISRGGFAFHASEPLQAGEHIVWVLPHSPRPIEMEAVCVRAYKASRASGAAVWKNSVEFPRRTPDSNAAIDKIIAESTQQTWRDRGVRNPTGLQSFRETKIDKWHCAIQVDPERPIAALAIDKKPGAAEQCPAEKIADWIIASGIVMSKTRVERLVTQIMTTSRLPIGATTVLARGMMAVDGHGGQLLWNVSLNENREPAPNDDEKFDHRDVALFCSVAAGDVICEISDPQSGMAGRDVFGAPIPPPPTSLLPLRLGEGVELVENPRRIIATVGGSVDFDGNSIRVAQIYKVHGDVDYNVGNIDFDGSVVITGNVIEGFRVAATGDVEIAGLVDSASVIAGGHIKIGGGVTGHGRSILRAGGDITAHYLNGVNVQAGRHIHIDRQVRGCTIVCGGNITVDRGGIVGGRVRAAGNVRTTCLGSEMYIATYVGAGVGSFDPARATELVARMGELHVTIERVEKLLAPLFGDTTLIAKLAKSDRAVFDQRRAELQNARDELCLIETIVIDSGTATGIDPTATIVVARDIFPNSEVQIGNESAKHFDEHMQGENKIIFDQEDEQIVVCGAHGRRNTASTKTEE